MAVQIPSKNAPKDQKYNVKVPGGAILFCVIA